MPHNSNSTRSWRGGGPALTGSRVSGGGVVPSSVLAGFWGGRLRWGLAEQGKAGKCNGPDVLELGYRLVTQCAPPTPTPVGH